MHILHSEPITAGDCLKVYQLGWRFSKEPFMQAFLSGESMLRASWGVSGVNQLTYMPGLPLIIHWFRKLYPDPPAIVNEQMQLDNLQMGINFFWDLGLEI